jgi:hypothetical protein
MKIFTVEVYSRSTMSEVQCMGTQCFTAGETRAHARTGTNAPVRTTDTPLPIQYFLYRRPFGHLETTTKTTWNSYITFPM